MKIYLILSIFLDVHSIGTTSEDDLLKEQNAPRDELGSKSGKYPLQFRSRSNLSHFRCAI
jgi:hypothetical protein